MADGAAAIVWQRNYWGNMVTLNKYHRRIAMQVITYAGLAKSSYLEALKYYRENDQTAYEQSMSNGDVKFSPSPRNPSSIVTAGENEYARTTNHNVDGACGKISLCQRTIKTLIQEIILLIESRGK